MLTMTSLTAQNQFGTLIDASQREPVAVTRHGRPVAVVLSYNDYMRKNKTISHEVAQFISQNFPLRGKEAAHALRSHFETMSNKAAEEGLTENDVLRMLNEK
jgi:antitoxin Phd